MLARTARLRVPSTMPVRDIGCGDWVPEATHVAAADRDTEDTPCHALTLPVVAGFGHLWLGCSLAFGTRGYRELSPALRVEAPEDQRIMLLILCDRAGRFASRPKRIDSEVGRRRLAV